MLSVNKQAGEPLRQQPVYNGKWWYNSLRRVYSLMVEQRTHNSLVAGSSPARPILYKRGNTMQELQYVLSEKLVQLNEKLGDRNMLYNDEYKNVVLHNIEEIVRDTCITHNCTYTISKFDINTTLFEITEIIDTLVLLVLFRKHGVNVCFSCY